MNTRFGLACVNYRYVAYPNWIRSCIKHISPFILQRRYTVFDAYAGSGAISIQFAKLPYVKKVIATERDVPSYQCLVHNTAQFPKIKPYNIDSLTYRGRCDILVLDPPWQDMKYLPIDEIYAWDPYIDKHQPQIIIINAPVRNAELPVFYGYDRIQDFCYAPKKPRKRVCSVLIYVKN